ncbi:thioredoxin family protein [Corynebacterium sp. CCM 8835]|uniref:Thioredoxin n=1 Tax=Corynebacterium antarcticum TaxID=2800405 RepID=A0ABS1FLM7_9CORY|nr:MULTISPECIES: thioredoxin family protein [Corynebacterium]MBV7293752.1 thioredoxin family protein [Corynebacterium sp. TAE3-ERU16]MCK7642716.1 thioredoxin family protein [Corynebacterium antarcticum]MCK7660597.1 thioredoxin family protein [Corynebacterium antarcticum]MCL0245342.1 thioredoxin family protein [Corynebacterium antarcticum]MCX7492203.1 thioredoxin family protein [Corynebacterium antarcticum]
MATIDVTEATFEETVTKGGIVLVDVWASWCGPCVRFAPTFEKVSEAHPEAVFAKLDSEANQGLAAALQIQSIPTLMIFRDGILVFRESGSMSAAALEDLYTQVSELDMDQVRSEMAKEQQSE